jgi:hypothetical protein
MVYSLFRSVRNHSRVGVSGYGHSEIGSKAGHLSGFKLPGAAHQSLPTFK